MQKVYPRDRDLPMLLYWCYATLQRMSDEQSRDTARRQGLAHGRVSGQSEARAPGTSREGCSVDPVLADRLQFAFTVMFHYLFPIGTIGLAPFVAAYTWKAARRRDAESARIAAFWTKSSPSTSRPASLQAFPWSFSLAHLGRVLAAQRGGYRAATRDGEHVCVLSRIHLPGRALYGRRGVPSLFTAWAAVLVCVGSWLSGFFIVETDAWMQHRFAMCSNRTARSGSKTFGRISSPFLIWQFTDVLNGALLAGGFIVAGVGDISAPRRDGQSDAV